jgi:lipoyl(octanoyl) transferase
VARRRVEWCFLGSFDYGDAVRLQARVRQAVKQGSGPERLLLLEHPPVYTLGRNAGSGEITADAGWLAARGIAVHESDRGGQATYHGPGQLVGYPILDLSPDRRDVRRYVADLCAVLVRTLAELGVSAAARPSPHVGVWVGEEKIASLGVHLSRWVTTHGFALNVTTDVGAFAGIVPCGLPGIALTSVERITGVAWPLPEVARRLVAHFADVFERELVAAPPPEPAAGEAAASPLTLASPG